MEVLDPSTRDRRLQLGSFGEEGEAEVASYLANDELRSQQWTFDRVKDRIRIGAEGDSVCSTLDRKSLPRIWLRIRTRNSLRACLGYENPSDVSPVLVRIDI